jgi:hypothetical protein
MEMIANCRKITEENIRMAKQMHDVDDESDFLTGLMK